MSALGPSTRGWQLRQRSTSWPSSASRPIPPTAACQAFRQVSAHGGGVDRRALLLGFVSGLVTPASSIAAEPASELFPPAVAFPAQSPSTPAPQLTDPSIYSYPWASDVPCNLRVREYYGLITQQRPGTWQRIAQHIQAGTYEELRLSLDAAQMADLRQAVLYLPWALLQSSDYTAAVDSFKAAKTFDEHVKDLQRTAAAAAAAVSNTAVPNALQQAVQVQQAFVLMSASLDALLSTVPVKYYSNSVFQQQPIQQPAQQPGEGR